MANRYRFGNSQDSNFITFAPVSWTDALRRPLYKDLILYSLKYCQHKMIFRNSTSFRIITLISFPYIK